MHQTTNASMTGNMVDPSLLDKIDKLFVCGVGDHIPLPQLVVVGDQSRSVHTEFITLPRRMLINSIIQWQVVGP